jgi:hypothetical protein
MTQRDLPRQTDSRYGLMERGSSGRGQSSSRLFRSLTLISIRSRNRPSRPSSVSTTTVTFRRESASLVMLVPRWTLRCVLCLSSELNGTVGGEEEEREEGSTEEVVGRMLQRSGHERTALGGEVARSAYSADEAADRTQEHSKGEKGIVRCRGGAERSSSQSRYCTRGSRTPFRTITGVPQARLPVHQDPHPCLEEEARGVPRALHLRFRPVRRGRRIRGPREGDQEGRGDLQGPGLAEEPRLLHGPPSLRFHRCRCQLQEAQLLGGWYQPYHR